MKRINKNIYFIIGYTCFLIAVIIALLYSRERFVRIPITGASIEQVEALGGWWLTVPAAENNELDSDINGTFFNEDYSKVYLILPRNIDETHIVFYVRDVADQYAMRCVEDFSEGEIILGSKTVILVKSALPFTYINVDKSQFEKMNNDVNRVEILQTEGHIICEDTVDEDVLLKLRGNSTRYYPKKSYGVELEKAKILLGMPKNRKWNMISNFCDLSILSNSVFYDLANEMGIPYTCDNELATVYINGEYRGVYLFTSKHNVDKNRINLKKGDYLLCLGDSELDISPRGMTYFKIESNYITYDGGALSGAIYSGDEGYNPLDRCNCFVIDYPKDNVNVEYISEFVQKAFEALEDKNSEDYLNYFDLDNMIKFYMLQEFSQNGDATSRSIYLFYDSSKKKLMFGPVWDLDNTLNLYTEDYTELVANRSWYRAFFLHDSFIDRLYKIYDEELRDAVYHSIDNYQKYAQSIELDGEMNLNLIREDYKVHFDNEVNKTYMEECEEKIDYYKMRVDHLNDIFLEHKIKEYVKIK